MIRSIRSTVLIFSTSLLLTAPTLGATPDEIDELSDPVAKGRAIAEEADRREKGFGDSEATMHMILRNARGQ